MRKITEVMKRDARGRFVAKAVKVFAGGTISGSGNDTKIGVFGGAFEHPRQGKLSCITVPPATRCDCGAYGLEWVNA